MNGTITATKNLKRATRNIVPVSRETSRIKKPLGGRGTPAQSGFINVIRKVLICYQIKIGMWL